MEHLQLHPAEMERLRLRIEDDLRTASQDHQTRLMRFRKYFESWRNLPDRNVDPQYATKYRVPLIQWAVFSVWAGLLAHIFGQDADVLAEPVGPADAKTVKKVSRFMRHLLFSLMRARKPLAQWILNTLICGRAFVYRPWEAVMKPGQNGEMEMIYDAPAMIPVPIEDLILPAERGPTSIHEFSWVGYRVHTTPQRLLNGERAGKYFGIRESFGEIVLRSRQQTVVAEDHGALQFQDARIESEGVQFRTADRRGREELAIVHWYGRWRLPRTDDADVLDDDFEQREMDQTDLLVTVIPDLNYRIIGIQKLADLAPNVDHPRPFSDMALNHTDGYWPAGIPELLAPHEDELTGIYRRYMTAADFNAFPPVFYRPGSGFDPQTQRLEPMTATPCDDPGSIWQYSSQSDLRGLMEMFHAVLGIVERILGVSDLALGKSMDRPNAPRTATGQVAILEAGNVRRNLDQDAIREDLQKFLCELWQMVSAYGDEEMFFRIAEEEAEGLFDVEDGVASMTSAERGGRFDFVLKFATTAWNKAAEAEKALQRYQLDIANPLIMQSPRAMWQITRTAHEALGDQNFADLVPEPPDLEVPKNPMHEWALMLQGEQVPVHPLDQDEVHIQVHQQQLEKAVARGNNDVEAIQSLVEHVTKHLAQAQQKRVMAAAQSALMQTALGMGMAPPMAGMGSGGAGPAQPPAMDAGMPAQTGDAVRDKVQTAMGGGGA